MICIDTYNFGQEATDELRISTSRVSDVQLGFTVNSLLSLTERMTDALRLDTLS